MVTDVTDDSFTAFVNENKMVVLDCWAAWCGPCLFLSPIINQLSNEHKDITFGKMNVDQNNTIPMKYGIMSIPTLLYFKDGQLVNRTVGVMPKRALEEQLERLRA